MKTLEKPVFDERQTALDLGYTQEQLQQFENISARLDHWNEEVGAGRMSIADRPEIDSRLLEDYDDFCEKMADLKVEFYFKHYNEF